jgi:hypothetical protein
VDSFELSRGRRKLNRDFSDGVLLAEILKFEFPNLVDLHNYSGCFAVNGKIENWDTLNRKVLVKLQMSLKPEEIEKLARAESNCIEEVLMRIMIRIDDIKNSDNETMKKVHGSSSVVRVTDSMREVPQQMVPLTNYEELLEKSNNQRKTLEGLQELVDDLRTALDTKSKIIEALQVQLEKKSKKSCRNSSLGSFKDSIANLF